MRNLTLTLGLAILFSSCSSTYFLTTVNTENTQTKKIENGDFLVENDSLWITYSFNGENAPITITVSNKLDKMLHIDWQKSAIVLNDEAFSYVGGKIEFKGKTTGTGLSYDSWLWSDQYQFYQGKTEGSFKLPSNMTSIPPKSRASNTPISLEKVNFEWIDKDAYHKFLMQDKEDNTIKVDRIDFTAQNTPLHIKSFLTLYYKESEPFVIEQDFYVENVMKTKSLTPNNLPEDIAKRGDLFYVKKEANKTFGKVLLGGVVVVGTAVEVSNDLKKN